MATPARTPHVGEDDRAHPTVPDSRLRAVCERLPEVIAKITPAGADPDTVLVVRAVLQQGHREIEPPDLPAVLRPRKGRFGLVDHEKVFCARPGADVFDLRGIDRDRGCVVLVRPDQYVAQVLPLDGFAELDRCLGQVCIRP